MEKYYPKVSLSFSFTKLTVAADKSHLEKSLPILLNWTVQF